MRYAFKCLFWLLVAGVILLPALVLILVTVGLSLTLSGAVAVSAAGVILSILLIMTIALTLMIPLVLGVIWFMQFETISVRFKTPEEKITLPVNVHLTGRHIYRMVFRHFARARRNGRHVVASLNLAIETYFREDLQGLLADHILEQYGPEMAEAFILDKRHRYNLA